MSAATCALLVQLAAWPLHDGKSLSRAWFNDEVGRHSLAPEEIEIGPRIVELSLEAKRLIAAFDGPVVNCHSAFRSAGFKRRPWPARPKPFYGSPDRQPGVTFRTVRFSPSGRHALVTWSYYFGPLHSGFHYALLEQTGSRWTLRLDGGFGPIS